MAKPRQQFDCFLSVTEVAELIALDDTTIRNGECGTGELLRIKLGARTVFSFLDVQAWMQRRIGEARAQRQPSEQPHTPAKLRLLKRINKGSITQFLKSLFC